MKTFLIMLAVVAAIWFLASLLAQASRTSRWEEGTDEEGDEDE